jgi:1-acyl-sn-glycerol-3-phosphate acyltransferase
MTTLERSLSSPEAPGFGAHLRRLYRVARIFGHILHGWVLALALDAFRRPRRPVVRRATRRWLIRTLAILGVEIEVDGEAIRGPALLVSNHVSWLDIPVLGSLRELHFLSKAEVRDWPLLGPLAAAAGTLFLRRGRGEARRRRADIAHQLGRGRTVLVFPEGTTTDGRAVKRFHGRLLGAAGDAGVPVQPVTVRYCTETGEIDPAVAFIDDDEFSHHLWHLMLRDRIRVRVTFHEPLVSRGDEADTDALADEAREAVASAV